MISLSWPTSRHTTIMRYFIALFIGYKANLTVSCTFSQNAWQNVRSPNSLGVQRTKKRGCWGLGRPGPTGSKSAPIPRYRSWARSTSRGPTCGSSSWSSPGAARPRPGACPIRFPGQRDAVSARFPIIAPVWRWTMLDYTPTACWSTTGRGGQGKDPTELKKSPRTSERFKEELGLSILLISLENSSLTVLLLCCQRASGLRYVLLWSIILISRLAGLFTIFIFIRIFKMRFTSIF